MRLIIKNFVRISHVDLVTDKPVIGIFGHNEQGKSSIGEALRFLFLDDNPRVKLKKDRDQLCHGGAKKGSVHLILDDVSFERNLRDGKLIGDVSLFPSFAPVIAEICLGAKRFVDLTDKERRALVIKLGKVDLSVDKIAAKLRERGIDAGTIKKYRPRLKAGLGPAHAEAKRRVSETRGAWQEVTGENYGSVKAEDWDPGEPVIGNEEAGANLAELDAEIIRLGQKKDAELAPVLSKIAQIQQQINEPDPLSCPHCGGAVLFDDGALKSYEGAADKERLSTQLNLANIKKRQITEKHATELSCLEEDKRALQADVAKAEDTETKKRRADELHQEIKTLTALQELLGEGPEGVAAELLGEGLNELNSRLRSLGEAIGWLPVAIHKDMSIQRADGYVYPLLSDSAKWRADAMLQILVSEYSEGFPWLVLDGFDIIEPKSRTGFIKWLDACGTARADECTIFLMATLKEPPNLEKLSGIDARWIENGTLAADWHDFGRDRRPNA